MESLGEREVESVPPPSPNRQSPPVSVAGSIPSQDVVSTFHTGSQDVVAGSAGDGCHDIEDFEDDVIW